MHEEKLKKSEERYHRYLDDSNLSCMFDKSDIEAKRNCGEDSDCSMCSFGQVQDRCYLSELQISGGNNGWIPCSERLPEKNKVVLCWVRSTTIASGETYIIGSCDNKCWFLQTYEIGYHHFPVKDYEVIAWQPLPESYKEGGME